MWEILGETVVDKRKCYVVRCSCGYEGTRRKDHVKIGRTKCCKNCSAKKTSLKYPPPITYKGVGDLSATFFHRIKYGAKRRGLDFEITIEFAWNIFLKQDKKCAYTGIDIFLEKVSKNQNPDYEKITASLDRIDSSKGYYENNVQWVHKKINRFKNNYTHKEFLTMCKEITEHSIKK